MILCEFMRGFARRCQKVKQLHAPLIHGAAVLGGVGPRHDDRVPVLGTKYFLVGLVNIFVLTCRAPRQPPRP